MFTFFTVMGKKNNNMQTSKLLESKVQAPPIKQIDVTIKDRVLYKPASSMGDDEY